MSRIKLALEPYVGLRPFTEREAMLFFGREQHVKDLLSKLAAQQRFIAVIGASGTGKSSLVRAGLISALHRGALGEQSHRWSIYTIQPGDTPLANLSAALAADSRWSAGESAQQDQIHALLRASPLGLVEAYRSNRERLGEESILLVVDQFEEIFRFRQGNIDEAEAFVKLLLRACAEPDLPIHVLITMRSDFLGNCVAFFGLPEAINSGIYLTPRLDRDQLAAVISSPLALVGGEIAPTLVTRLINTLGGDDELPILQHALARMWQRAKQEGRSRIEESDFLEICAWRGVNLNKEEPAAPKIAYALDNHASEIYETLSKAQQAVARQLFLALSERREGREVRRPQTLAELVEQVGASKRDDIAAVLDAYREEGVGFVLPPKSTAIRENSVIDISHESLIRQWRAFRRWLDDEDIDVGELREWQTRAARQRDESGWLDEADANRAGAWLQRAQRRGNPQAWGQRYLPNKGESAFRDVVSYIDGSEAYLLERRAEKRRGQEEKERFAREKQEAELQNAQREAAQAQREKERAEDFARRTRRKTFAAMAFAAISVAALGLAIIFLHRAESATALAKAQGRDALVRQLLTKAESLLTTKSDEGIVLALAARRINPLPEADGLVRYLSARNNFASVLRGHEGGVTQAVFSSDGKTVLTASGDNTARLWACAVCSSVDAAAKSLARRIGMELSAQQRARFGIPEDLSGAIRPEP